MKLGCNLNILFLERDKKYRDVVHQHDVWHGGKNLVKKINGVGFPLWNKYSTGTMVTVPDLHKL